MAAPSPISTSTTFGMDADADLDDCTASDSVLYDALNDHGLDQLAGIVEVSCAADHVVPMTVKSMLAYFHKSHHCPKEDNLHVVLFGSGLIPPMHTPSPTCMYTSDPLQVQMALKASESSTVSVTFVAVHLGEIFDMLTGGLNDKCELVRTIIIWPFASLKLSMGVSFHDEVRVLNSETTSVMNAMTDEAERRRSWILSQAMVGYAAGPGIMDPDSFALFSLLPEGDRMGFETAAQMTQQANTGHMSGVLSLFYDKVQRHLFRVMNPLTSTKLLDLTHPLPFSREVSGVLLLMLTFSEVFALAKINKGASQFFGGVRGGANMVRSRAIAGVRSHQTAVAVKSDATEALLTLVGSKASLFMPSIISITIKTTEVQPHTTTVMKYMTEAWEKRSQHLEGVTMASLEVLCSNNGRDQPEMYLSPYNTNPSPRDFRAMTEMMSVTTRRQTLHEQRYYRQSLGDFPDNLRLDLRLIEGTGGQRTFVLVTMRVTGARRNLGENAHLIGWIVDLRPEDNMDTVGMTVEKGGLYLIRSHEKSLGFFSHAHISDVFSDLANRLTDMAVYGVFTAGPTNMICIKEGSRFTIPPEDLHLRPKMMGKCVGCCVQDGVFVPSLSSNGYTLAPKGSLNNWAETVALANQMCQATMRDDEEDEQKEDASASSGPSVAVTFVASPHGKKRVRTHEEMEKC
jgi:hypothetical protein